MTTYSQSQTAIVRQFGPSLHLQGARLKERVVDIFFILFSEPDLPEERSKRPKQVDDYARLLGELIAKKWISEWSKKSYDKENEQKTTVFK